MTSVAVLGFNLLPFAGNFLKFMGIGDVTFDVTALRANVIIEGGNGCNTDRDGIAGERAAFRVYIRS